MQNFHIDFLIRALKVMSMAYVDLVGGPASGHKGSDRMDIDRMEEKSYEGDGSSEDWGEGDVGGINRIFLYCVVYDNEV